MFQFINQSQISGTAKNLRSRGFTLLELVVVIVLIGILSAVAVQTVINMESNARKALIEDIGVKLTAASDFIYAKSVVLGIHNNDRNDTISSRDLQGGFYLEDFFVSTIHGYIWFHSPSVARNLLHLDITENVTSNDLSRVCTTSKDFCFKYFAGFSGATRIINAGVPSYHPGNSIAIFLPGQSFSDHCFAYYLFDRTDDTAHVGIVTSGC